MVRHPGGSKSGCGPLNLHFHILFIDGVYEQKENSKLAFHQVSAPNADELNALVVKISHRVARYLEKQGLLTRDDENSYLTMDGLDDSVMNELQGHSITYRIAVGPQQGRKVFTLQTIPAWEDDFSNSQVGKIAGFSLHAGVATEARQRKKLDRSGGVPLCRYISRPAVSEKRLALTSNGNVRLVRHPDHLKTPYRDGTTHVIFEPLDFIAKLAAMVPKPRINLTRFHGVLVGVPHQPNSKHRINVTPAKRAKGSAKKTSSTTKEKSSAESHESLTWAERLKRVFNIDVSVCSRCGGARNAARLKSSPALRSESSHRRGDQEDLRAPGYQIYHTCRSSGEAPSTATTGVVVYWRVIRKLKRSVKQRSVWFLSQVNIG